MAATPFQAPTHNNSFVFDIYNDGAPARKAPDLPGGQCNFVDLTHGANGARCGCRRFWSRITSAPAFTGSPNGGQDVWCMCSHHACFHFHYDIQTGAGQAAPTTDPATNAVFNIPGQENERPRTNRDPLSLAQEFPLQIPSITGVGMGMSMDFPAINLQGPSGTLDLDALGRLPGETSAPAPATECSLPDTMPWGQYIGPSQGGGPPSLPPIPSQCLMPSQPPSTSRSSQMRYLQPFHGKGVEALSGPSAPVPPAETATSDYVLGEATQEEKSRAFPPAAATPVVRDTQEFINTTLSSGPSISRPEFQQLTDAVHSHETRIDKLETASFTGPDHDICIDKHENVDVRVMELESRVDDVEKRLNDDNSTVVSASREQHSITSTSRGSSSAVWSQIQSLQAQVTSLRSNSLPSYNQPWEVEVVMLPFPLRGIWQTPNELQKDWTQLPATYGRQTPDPQPPLTSDWLHPDSEAGWLVPRACVPGRVIDARLKSRGLVRTLSVRGFDARSVQLAINNAFSPLLRTLAGPSPSSRSDPAWHTCLGLQQPWVPLRKMHKDSRLRFLTPAEMATPALWDVPFLRSSVVMKASGVQRLYVTQPEAYMQHCRDADSAPWTWQRIRELSRVYPDSQGCSATGDGASQSGVGTPEADAAEECWAWNERLDEPSPPAQTGKVAPPSLRSARSSTDESSQLFHTGRQSPRHTSPILGTRAQRPLTHGRGGLRDRRGVRPPHVRTTSLPPVAAAYSPSSAHARQQRRVVSHNTASARPGSSAAGGMGHDRRSSPLVPRPSPRVALASSPLMGAVSKRRATRSPSLMPRTTPRWSVERSPSLLPDAPRGTTPFCYATPFSNAGFDNYPPGRQTSRPPAGAYGDGYEGGDDMDCGSDTDPYDSQVTRDGEEGEDEDLDFPVYEDEDDELGDADAEWNAAQLREVQEQARQPGQQAPEDEPWPGIEDGMSDGENVDPEIGEEGEEYDDGAEDAALSEASSCPSEYPSTQRAWGMPDAETKGEAPGLGEDDVRAGFRIHEDGM